MITVYDMPLINTHFSQRKLSMPRRRRVEKHQRGVTHHVYQRYNMMPLHKTVSSLLPLPSRKIVAV